MLLHMVMAVQSSGLGRRLQRGLNSEDLALHIVTGKNHVWERVAHYNADIILISRELIPTPLVENIKSLRQLPDCVAVVVLVGQENAQERAALLTAGCDAVLNTGLAMEVLCSTISAIVDRQRIIHQRELTGYHLTAQARLQDFISNSPAMITFMNIVRRVIGSEAPLLILGETGTGKERLARAIHVEGPNASGPFVAVNCGALPETLLESELFGHEQGAFTGATRRRRGCFELAHQGTIFLDEIGEMPLHLQVRLLRVLQDYEVQPIGSENAIKVKVRLMASTNRQLEHEVEQGRFRRDLYYRLSVVSLMVPPLRQRREDIPALVNSYIDFFRKRIGSGQYEVIPETLDALCRYAWPGNVRELINVIERAMLLSNRDKITPSDLPETISGCRPASGAISALAPSSERSAPADEAFYQGSWRSSRRRIVDYYEREYFTYWLRRTNGRISATAKQAGICSRSLFEKLKKHHLDKKKFKNTDRLR
ncbi:MAG: sigma-54-dependent Fis family transcriptional regulator [Sedimentisphaerales bacterium]|nr:sigma-54-dependent Fis family transcriptional regulator [Sedimentisphaerales bacterium]